MRNLKKIGIHIDSRHIFDANIARGIVESAVDTHSDAILMISRKYRGLQGLLTSRNTAEVIRESDVPVIVL